MDKCISLLTMLCIRIHSCIYVVLHRVSGEPSSETDLQIRNSETITTFFGEEIRLEKCHHNGCTRMAPKITLFGCPLFSRGQKVFEQEFCSVSTFVENFVSAVEGVAWVPHSNESFFTCTQVTLLRAWFVGPGPFFNKPIDFEFIVKSYHHTLKCTIE